MVVRVVFVVTRPLSAVSSFRRSVKRWENASFNLKTGSVSVVEIVAWKISCYRQWDIGRPYGNSYSMETPEMLQLKAREDARKNNIPAYEFIREGCPQANKSEPKIAKGESGATANIHHMSAGENNICYIKSIYFILMPEDLMNKNNARRSCQHVHIEYVLFNKKIAHRTC